MQNGIIVFPLKSVVLKNERTGGANVFSQLGEPMKIVSKSSIFASLVATEDNTPFQFELVPLLLPCYMKRNTDLEVQALVVLRP